VEDNVVEAMQALGFTSGEAKVYAALVRKQPSTGYELAASSGVPRSAIYNILRRLETSGLANAIQDKPARYVAIEPERLCDLLKGRFETTIDDLRDSLSSMVRQSGGALLWPLRDERGVLEHATSLIENAETTIVASVWSSHEALLQPVLEAARARGVDVSLFSFTDLPERDYDIYTYGLSENALAEHWQKRLMIVADRKTLLLSQTDEGGGAEGVVTEDRVLIEMASNNLVLDLTLFSQRYGQKVTSVIEQLVPKPAPIDELLEFAKPRFPKQS